MCGSCLSVEMTLFCKMFGIPVFCISYGSLIGESVQKRLTVRGVNIFVHWDVAYISVNLNILKRS